MVDMATRLAAMRLLKGQGSAAVIKGVRRGRIRPYKKIGKIAKAERRSDVGTWVGKSEVDDARLVRTENGTLKFRTIQRLPEEERFQEKVFLAGKGTPRNPLALARGSVPPRARGSAVLRARLRAGAQNLVRYHAVGYR